MNEYQDNSNMQNSGMQEKGDNLGGLPTASRVCGIISMILGISTLVACCLGYLSIPLGALGILFAILSRRKGQPMNHSSKTGMTLSIIGMLIGIIMLALSIFYTITDPNFWEETNEIYKEYEEMYEELYGIELEDYNL